jgi:hypothetical protein
LQNLNSDGKIIYVTIMGYISHYIGYIKKWNGGLLMAKQLLIKLETALGVKPANLSVLITGKRRRKEFC